MILLKAQYTHIGHFRQIEKIRNLGFLDIQKNMKQDTLDFRACVALCFDEIHHFLKGIAAVNGMENPIFQTLCHLCNLLQLLNRGGAQLIMQGRHECIPENGCCADGKCFIIEVMRIFGQMQHGFGAVFLCQSLPHCACGRIAA